MIVEPQGDNRRPELKNPPAGDGPRTEPHPSPVCAAAGGSVYTSSEAHASGEPAAELLPPPPPPPLFHETMSAAFAENLRRFVRCLPPEAAQEVLAGPLEDSGNGGSEQEFFIL